LETDPDICSLFADVGLPGSYNGREPADEALKEFEMTVKGTILLVEDEALIAAVTAETLRDLGFKVEEAVTAAAALAFAKGQPENIMAAIVDMNLPDGKGSELAKKLRALKPDLPIVIATGTGDKTLAGELEKGGPLALLSKPYDSDGLRKSLATVGLE
jgi:CheY-like chemotaxis protein